MYPKCIHQLIVANHTYSLSYFCSLYGGHAHLFLRKTGVVKDNYECQCQITNPNQRRDMIHGMHVFHLYLVVNCNFSAYTQVGLFRCMDHQICACLKCWFNLIYISCVTYMLSSVTLLCHVLWLLHISGHILHSLYSYKSAQLYIIFVWVSPKNYKDHTTREYRSATSYFISHSILCGALSFLPASQDRHCASQITCASAPSNCHIKVRHAYCIWWSLGIGRYIIILLCVFH